MENSKNTQFIKREIKDSVFTALFSESFYRLQLLKTLHPEYEDAIESDVTSLTLNNVRTNQQYNDLAILCKDSLMVFVSSKVIIQKIFP